MHDLGHIKVPQDDMDRDGYQEFTLVHSQKLLTALKSSNLDVLGAPAVQTDRLLNNKDSQILQAVKLPTIRYTKDRDE